MAIPVLSYRSEMWATKKNNRRIGAAKMRFLRTLARVTLRDQKGSEYFRQELQINNNIKDNFRLQK
jgi:hypothetical protein